LLAGEKGDVDARFGENVERCLRLMAEKSRFAARGHKTRRVQLFLNPFCWDEAIRA